MQDILLPLLVINLLLTVWLLRQHILRQGRRHRRREELAEWRSHIDLRIKQHFETLVNQSEIFVEHRSAMAEINKDHYALNERLDGISVYDIKAILPRLKILEAQAGHFSNFDARLEKREEVIGSLQDSVVSLGDAITSLSAKYENDTAYRNTKTGEMLLRLSAAEESLAHHTAKINEFMSFKYVYDGWADSIDREIKAAKAVRAVNSDRVSKLESEVSTLTDGLETVVDNYGSRLTGHTERLMALERGHKNLAATTNTLCVQYQELYDRAKPFDPDTLIDSLDSDLQQETADPVGYAERRSHPKKKPGTDYNKIP